MAARKKKPVPLNAEWHRAHRMPKNPTTDQRRAHEAHCGCRPMPERLRALLATAGGRQAQRG